MDFVQDSPEDGRKTRTLNIIYNREALAMCKVPMTANASYGHAH